MEDKKEITFSEVERLTNKLDEEVDIFERNILVRTWKYAVGYAWAFFITYQILIGVDRLYSKNPLCPFRLS